MSNKKFIDKNKVIKLSHRAPDDPNFKQKNKDEIVYEIV